VRAAAADIAAMGETEAWLLGAGALAGALLATLVCRWHAMREVARWQARLQMTELARQAMQQRSDQARLQIGQLTKALADANRQQREAHPPLPAVPQQPPAPPAEVPDEEVLLSRRGPPEAFPPTQVL
jgi:hypothetical protein